MTPAETSPVPALRPVARDVCKAQSTTHFEPPPTDGADGKGSTQTQTSNKKTLQT